MTLFLEINSFWSCNFKCPTCSAVTYRQPLSREQKIRENQVNFEFFEPVITDFLTTYPKGTIKVEGGEPLYHFNKFLNIVQQIRKRYLNPILTVSNCSYLQDPKCLEQFEASGITRLDCSLNSHIPEAHHLSRGLPVESLNCKFVMSLPKKLRSISVGVSAIPCEYNINHLKDFTKRIYDLGFKSITWCFYKKETPSFIRWVRENKAKLIKFYLWIQRQIGDFRKFIQNPDNIIEQTLKWYLTGKIHQACKAPSRTIFINYDNIIYPCWGTFNLYELTQDKSFRYTLGDIGNPESYFNLLRSSLPSYCFKKCSLDACYF